MGNISTAIIVVEGSLGRAREHTCVHPPGAAHKSRTVRVLLFNIENLRLICVNLKAARERNPCSFATVIFCLFLLLVWIIWFDNCVER